MTADGLRRLRVFFKFGLLISLPVAGYLWAQTGVSAAAIAMSAVCVVMAIGAEGLASAAESRLARLRAIANAGEFGFQTDITNKDERIRQMDRIVETLSNQNHDLRGKLVSLHGEAHRVESEYAELFPETPAGEAEADAEAEAGEGDAEVTDISSLRTRR
jgi:hypothetical protein